MALPPSPRPYVGRLKPTNQAERTASPASRGRSTRRNVHVHLDGLETSVEGRGEKVKKMDRICWRGGGAQGEKGGGHVFPSEDVQLTHERAQERERRTSKSASERKKVRRMFSWICGWLRRFVWSVGRRKALRRANVKVSVGCGRYKARQFLCEDRRSMLS